jgi:enoyl-CoA hydratase
MDDIQFQIQKNIGRITINRPSAMNAMTYDMVAAMSDYLHRWADDDRVRAVMIDGAGTRAFCAGGDIRALYDYHRGGRNRDIHRFFHAEYNLNYQIARYPKPYIAVIDGITMGGGVGVSIHGSHIIATPNTRFAMPEAKIGFFPDVGAMHFLRAAGVDLGKTLALTGRELSGPEMVSACLATHYTAHSKKHITQQIVGHDGELDGVLRRLSDPIDITINQQFDTVYYIDKLAADHPELCPFSLALIDRYYDRVREMDLKTVLGMDYYLVNQMIERPDMMEGIRAMIIDKDKSPNWRPSQISQIDMDDIRNMLDQAEKASHQLYQSF